METTTTTTTTTSIHTTDPYEQKLYQMFENHNPDANGLNEKSLMKLCQALELNDHGNYLIQQLIQHPESRVTFKAFKESLLNFLGEINSTNTLPTTTTCTSSSSSSMTTTMSATKLNVVQITEIPQLVISEKNTNNDGDVDNGKYLNDGPISPGREISPKLIMGVKKYGRRSRPQSLVTDSSSHSDDNDDQQHSNLITDLENKSQMVQRSSSQSEIHKNHRRRPTSGNSKLKRCVSLPAQKKKHQAQQKPTPEQQQLLIKNQPPNSSSVESLDLPQQNDTTIPANNIIDMWETANIKNPKNLLINLGFEDDMINIIQLMKVLDEELRNNNNTTIPINQKTQIKLLKASLVLQKSEYLMLQQSYRHLYDENKKLYMDNKDANKRATLLAQEIDERHANLEDSTKTEIRLLEQRHADLIRDLTTQLANERENWSNINQQLEKKIEIFEQDEIKLKNDIQFLHKENTTLELDHASLQKQITNLLETNIKLNNEMVEIADKQRAEQNTENTEEILELIEKITYLQNENTNLRDKNDEFSSEIENLNMELMRFQNNHKNKKSNDEKIVIYSASTIESLTDDLEYSSIGVKRRGDSPSKTKLPEESPRTGKLRKCNDNNNNNSESETSGDWVALNSEIKTTASTTSTFTLNTTSGYSDDSSNVSTDLKIHNNETNVLNEKIQKLENELKELKSSNCNAEKIHEIQLEMSTINEHCKELENSLEQMRKAYEDCEDYWQTKLNNERQLFENERQIYEDEQHENDKKFLELMSKINEYEDQYSSNKINRLTPIEEKDILEQQFAEMEAEVKETHQNTQKLLNEKAQEIELLHEQINNLTIQQQHTINQNCINTSTISSGGCNLFKTTYQNIQKQNVADADVQQQQTEIISPASSPISYLWNQSTIQAPARDYQNPNWNQKLTNEASRIKNLTTSETTIFSTTPSPNHNNSTILNTEQQSLTTPQSQPQPLNPIQKPNKDNHADDQSSSSSSSTESPKSFDSQSVASSVHSLQQKSSIAELSLCSSPNIVKEELKRLKYFEVQLREQIQDLGMKRDSLVMELQQLQEAKPVLEKAYARAAHPTLIQRVNILEQKNRHLQTVLRQQQQYTESIMHQTWQQQRAELNELRNRLETQGIIMTEQAQRLANADLLVKDLYVENSHLSATIQRLEQQRSRANLIHQHQTGLSGVPGMP